MKKIQLPDPQLVEMEALDRAFDEWIDKSDLDSSEANYLASYFYEADRNAPIFTAEDVDEAFGGDFDESVDVLTHAMSRNLQERIDHKKRVIREINDEPYIK